MKEKKENEAAWGGRHHWPCGWTPWEFDGGLEWGEHAVQHSGTVSFWESGVDWECVTDQDGAKNSRHVRGKTKKIMRHIGEGGRPGDQKFLNPPQPLGTFLSLQYLASTGSPSANEGGGVGGQSSSGGFSSGGGSRFPFLTAVWLLSGYRPGSNNLIVTAVVLHHPHK